MLSLYSRYAHKPHLELTEQTKYKYALKKVPGHSVYRGTIELKYPLESNPPYPHSSYRPQFIDGIMIDRVRLTIGVLPCPDAHLQPEEDEGGTPGEALRFFESKSIHCGSTTGPAKDYQKLMSAEASIASTGCWPDEPRVPGLPSHCELEDDAGR